MKKKEKMRLGLSKETIRILNGPELERVWGATGGAQTNTNCGCITKVDDPPNYTQTCVPTGP